MVVAAAAEDPLHDQCQREHLHGVGGQCHAAGVDDGAEPCPHPLPPQPRRPATRTPTLRTGSAARRRRSRMSSPSRRRRPTDPAARSRRTLLRRSGARRRSRAPRIPATAGLRRSQRNRCHPESADRDEGRHPVVPTGDGQLEEPSRATRSPARPRATRGSRPSTSGLTSAMTRPSPAQTAGRLPTSATIGARTMISSPSVWSTMSIWPYCRCSHSPRRINNRPRATLPNTKTTHPPAFSHASEQRDPDEHREPRRRQVLAGVQDARPTGSCARRSSRSPRIRARDRATSAGRSCRHRIATVSIR